MTCRGCAGDVDGVEVSHIQQRAVLRDLHRALVDPQLDGVVLARATKSEQWMEGYNSAVELVDTRVEHLTGHIEGLADAVPPVPGAQLAADRDVFDVVTDAWAMWCYETSVQDAEMSDGERAGFKVAATHMRDPRLRARIRGSLPARAADPAAGGDLAALREVLDDLAAVDNGSIRDASVWHRRLTAALAPAPTSEAATEGGVQNEHGDVDLIDEAWSLLTSEDRDDAWEAARDRWGVRYGQNEPPRGGPDRARLLEEMWRRRVAATPREQGTAEAATEAPGNDADAWRLRYSALVGKVDGWVAERFGDAAREDLVADLAVDGWFRMGVGWHALAATPRAEGEAAAGELHDHAETVASAAAELNMFTVSAPMRARLRDDLVVVENALRAHRCAPPAPEVVGGAEAADLPDGSVAVQVLDDGQWMPGAIVRRVERDDDRFHDDCTYIVLERTTPSPAVGDMAETAADLDRLPTGAVVRSKAGVVSEKVVDQWLVVGIPHSYDAGALSTPARVLYLPEAGA